jgi:hypothetical protein
MSDLPVKFPEPCAEKWEEMLPTGCNRFCASCNKTIYDLSQYSFDEAETLLHSNDKLCVRAELDLDGSIKLKAKSKISVNRMVAAVSVTAGLLTLSGQAAAAKYRAEGIIAGKIDSSYNKTKVVAIGSNGKKYRAKTRVDGTYEIKRLPPDTYKIEFASNCGYPNEAYQWVGETVVVREKEVTTSNSKDEYECPIIVGMIEIVEVHG